MLLSPNLWIVVVVTVAAVALCVSLHYEALRLIAKRPTKHYWRRRMIFLILALLAIHIIEIWIFAIANYGLLQFDGFGHLEGMEVVDLYNCVYYSAIVFTTLGFGDIVPVGYLRLLTGVEAIAGLTFITWSASFMFLNMEQAWRGRGHSDP